MYPLIKGTVRFVTTLDAETHWSVATLQKDKMILLQNDAAAHTSHIAESFAITLRNHVTEIL
jgi:hypothetical protein